jgi:D-glycero-D-manno-heptose 1,7-bisphosphate phosphatase
MNKALFLDLDHTLIRPKSFKDHYIQLPKNHTEEEEAAAYELAASKIPRDATDVAVQPHQLSENGELIIGYVWRNVFPLDVYDWEFMPGILQAIRYYLEEGWLLIVISNQGGIEAGYHSTAEIAGKISSVLAAVRGALNVEATGNFYICPSMNKEDYDRKPNPGMLYRAQKHQKINLEESLFIGDMDSDRECAKRAGVSYMDIKEFLRTHAS